MKKYAAAHVLLDETKKQQARFEKLYGAGDYTTTIAKNMKRTIWLIVAFIVLVMLLLILQLYKLNQPYPGVSLDKKGNIVSVVRPAAGDATIILNAEVISESGKTISDQSFKVMIAPTKTKEQKESEINVSMDSKEDAFQHEIRKAVYQMNSDTNIKTVVMPKELSDGTRIHWAPQKTYNGWMTVLVMIFGCFAIYYYRNAGLLKAEKAAKESVLRELPEFVNKLVLLLNAGLVLSNAFTKIVSDNLRIKGGEKNYFYEQLSHIIMKCQQTNGNVQHEIRAFAVRTGIVEFMRLANIINDSMTKGFDLVTQLKMEGDNLWVARRKHMEEKGKIAETKLTFPLVILLLVLLLITITPAMMEM